MPRRAAGLPLVIRLEPVAFANHVSADDVVLAVWIVRVIDVFRRADRSLIRPLRRLLLVVVCTGREEIDVLERGGAERIRRTADFEIIDIRVARVAVLFAGTRFEDDHFHALRSEFPRQYRARDSGSDNYDIAIRLLAHDSIPAGAVFQ